MIYKKNMNTYIYRYNSMSDKQQFLDPISTVGRIILLFFSTPKTKIRIFNHAVQLIENVYTDDQTNVSSSFTNNISSLVSSVSRKMYGDSRADISVLYPIFVRYIELYLVEKYKKADASKVNTINEISELEITQDTLCYKYLKKLAEYAIVGMKELQKTYGRDNATFTLQYYIDLLKQGINNDYSEESLPENLKELTKHNLIDDSKIQRIWDDTHIIELGKTFENCFKAKITNDNVLLNANKNKILNLLDNHDEIFREKINTDK